MAPMSPLSLLAFNQRNRKMLALLFGCHLIWGALVVVFWALGNLMPEPTPFWANVFVAAQIFAAAQLILPALLLDPEERSRSFYLFWALLLALVIWLVNQFPSDPAGAPLFAVLKSTLLLLAGTLVAAALARYVKRLWEIVPVCLMMTLADFASWLVGPTAGFVQQLETYYRTAEGPPPVVEMILVKLAIPGSSGLVAVFGVSDWIMVVFFAMVARHFDVNDNLIGRSGQVHASRGRLGGYLPVSVVALYLALVVAQLTGLFVPALPLIAVVMLLWYLARHLVSRGA